MRGGSCARSYWSMRARYAAATPRIDVHEVLSWYGGMGSINDLIIARISGHRVEDGNEGSLNHKLDELREKVHATASALLC